MVNFSLFLFRTMVLRAGMLVNENTNCTLFILAGGLGSRLREVEPDIPKPIVDILGVPFICRLIEQYKSKAFTKIVVSTGFKAEIVERTIRHYSGNGIEFVRESIPLGTGGALINFASQCKTENIIVINGDTYFDNLEWLNLNEVSFSNPIIYGKHATYNDRYGTIISEDGKFRSWGLIGASNLIHIGVFSCSLTLLKKTYPELQYKNLSLEKHIIPKIAIDNQIKILEINCDFIDIGVPADLAKFRSKYE